MICKYVCPICGTVLYNREHCTCMDKHRNMYQKKQFNYDCIERMGIKNDTLRINRPVSGASEHGRGR